MRRSLLEPRWISHSFVVVMLLACLWVWVRQSQAEAAGSRSTGYRVDVNHAGEVELAALPGLGPSTARRIIASRDELGRFDTPESLMRVQGIGPGRVRQLRPWVVCGPGVAQGLMAEAAVDPKKNSSPHDEPLFIEITGQQPLGLTP